MKNSNTIINEQKPQPMEKLIVTIVEQMDAKKAEALVDRFSKNPLGEQETQLAREILERTLNRDEKYILFNAFGIDCEKRSMEEIAMSMRYSIEGVRRFYGRAIRKASKAEAVYRLMFLAYDETEAYIMVAERQIAIMSEVRDLEQMTAALEAKTGKKIIEGRHPIWDEFGRRICWTLAEQGIMTLEDISEMGINANRIKGISGYEWFELSEALDRYGLDNRISSAPPILPERFNDIAFKMGEEEIKIYFHPATYDPDPKDMEEMLGWMIVHNYCIGGDLGQLSNGEIKLFFNPLIHESYARNRARETVETALVHGWSRHTSK